MEEKINRHLLLMGLLAMLLTFVLTVVAFRGSFDSQVKEDLHMQTTLIASAYNPAQAAEQLSTYASAKLRVTLVESDGTVLYETDADASAMENHLERPEIQQALSSGSGQAVRDSATLGIVEYYDAMQLTDGKILRCSVSSNIAGEMFWACSPYLVVVLLSVVALSVLLSSLLTKRLVKPIKQMAKRLDEPDLVSDDNPAIYRELVPFVREIQSQRMSIKEQLQTIDLENEKLTAIMQHMEEGLLLLDMRKNVLVANDSALRYLHATSYTPRQHLIELTRDKMINDAAQAAVQGQHMSLDIDDDGRQLQLMTNPVIYEDEQLGVICMMVDVTERRELERMKQEFTANVSHELKTPLTSISGYAEMIGNGMAQADDVRPFAQRIQKEAARLLALIRDIIKLSEIEENGTEIASEQVALHEVAAECITRLEPAAVTAGVTMLLTGELTVTGNRSMLEELVYNLCDNAVRYNREGGQVAITLSEHCLTVSDTGIGIPAAHQSRVFERFYRVDKSRSKATGGTGLGLAIVKHIAEAHHASVSLQSREGFGTAISITFPA